MAKKDKGIPLSPKHGVNPSLAKCFWCGKTMGVALVGRIRKDGDDDAEAPREACFGLEPCDKCREHFAKGVLFIEAVPDGSTFGGNASFALKVPGGDVMWPTGRWAVVKPEAVKDGKAGERALCSPEVMDQILSAQSKGEKSEKDETGGKGEK